MLSILCLVARTSIAHMSFEAASCASATSASPVFAGRVLLEPASFWTHSSRCQSHGCSNVAAGLSTRSVLLAADISIQQLHVALGSNFIQVHLTHCMPWATPGEGRDGLQPSMSACSSPAQQSLAISRQGPQGPSSSGADLAEQALEAAIASGNPQQLTSAIHAAVRALGNGIAGIAVQTQVWTLHSLFIKGSAYQL